MNKPSLFIATLALAACQPDRGSTLNTSAVGAGSDPQRVILSNAPHNSDAGGGAARFVGARDNGAVVLERAPATNTGAGCPDGVVITRIRDDGRPVVECRP